ncbi:MAG: putative extracellular nuclease [Candidatus Latescibacterota bacterium]|jgi:predicted extracellular nuclease
MTGASEKEKNQYAIAFYNVENLFDTVDDPATFDDAFTAKSKRKWNESRLKKKLKKIGRIISNIGFDESGHPPAIIGVAEVENAFVLEALIASKFLKNKGYAIVHFDSPDERGIDTALLYRSNYFKVTHAKAHNVFLTNLAGNQDFTRDILQVQGLLDGKSVHILVNHWPSRHGGATETALRRIVHAKKAREIIAMITSEAPDARIIVMGDFNDDPNSESIKHLVSNDFHNPMVLLLTNNEGSSSYRGEWNLFDQIIVSHNFMRQYGNTFRLDEAKIYNAKSLQAYKGKNKGTPFRTYAGRKYLGGMSDHFPVYALFTIEK